MIAAFLERDSQYEGVFFTGVKTTGIFCRPTCRARKPKPENVEFFRTTGEALNAGYRPCKVCRPMEPVGATPEWVRDLLQHVERSDHRVGDEEVRAMGLQPATVRRWFKKHHGMTFHAYTRHLRIGRAYGTIRGDSSVTDAAFSSGYESLSGFGDAFKRELGFVPSRSRSLPIAVLTRIPTPLGPMIAVASTGRLQLLEFTDRPMLETQLKRVRRDLGTEIVSGDDPLFERLHRELGEYFAGSGRTFDIPIGEFGSSFQRSVWRALRDIPYGETRSYAEQATAIGRPSAVRAVARANGDNRIAIIIPCHRVIGSDGSMTGYGGGVWRKRALLQIEAADVGS